jgi:putative SOS response-associated peptidase YedK
MCGRYTATFDKRELESYLGLSAEHLDFHPRYNIAPTQSVPVQSEVAGNRTLSLMRWGLKPRWSKHLLINARAETLDQKPSFRPLLAQRCLVPADGFFEWKAFGRTKVPYRVTRTARRCSGYAAAIYRTGGYKACI